jgi:predicted ATPase
MSNPLYEAISSRTFKPGSALHVRAEGLHGHFTLDLSLRERLTVIHGRNGTGKTTLLHVLANVANGDLSRFYFLIFNTIRIGTAQHELELRRVKGGKKLHLALDGTDCGVIPPPEDEPHGRPAGGTFPGLSKVFGGRAVYLPAFRSILESIQRRREEYAYRIMSDRQRRAASQIAMVEDLRDDLKEPRGTLRLSEERARSVGIKTAMCREWFGQFVPIIRTAALQEIDYELHRELRSAEVTLARADTATLSQVFISVLTRLFEGGVIAQRGTVAELLDEVSLRLREFPAFGAEQGLMLTDLLRKKADRETQSEELRQVLTVYAEALRERQARQKKTFEALERFEIVVNQFLEGKRLRIVSKGANEQSRSVSLEFAENSYRELAVLSSGERQLISLLFSATHLTGQDGPVLIDEPELSLHVDWQRQIVQQLMGFAQGRQIIVCTHSPEIAAGDPDALIEPQVSMWQGPELRLPLAANAREEDEIPF